MTLLKKIQADLDDVSYRQLCAALQEIAVVNRAGGAGSRRKVAEILHTLGVYDFIVQ